MIPLFRDAVATTLGDYWALPPGATRSSRLTSDYCHDDPDKGSDSLESRFHHRSRGKSMEATPGENTGISSPVSAPPGPAGDASSQYSEGVAPASEPPRNTLPDHSHVVGALPSDTVGAMSVIPEETLEENGALLLDGETQDYVRGNRYTGNNKTGKRTESAEKRERGANA